MKRLAKRTAYALFTLLAIPVWMLYRLQSLVLDKNISFYDYSQLMSLFPGTLGNYLRYGFYRLTLKRLGEDACICFGATLAHPEIEIDKGAYIGPFCNLGLCSIGEAALLGTGVHVLSGLHQHGSDDLETPMRDQPGRLERIKVGKYSWVGNKAVIAADVGEKSIVGAGSLVLREIPAYAVAAGNPAKVFRDRRERSNQGHSGAEDTPSSPASNPEPGNEIP